MSKQVYLTDHATWRVHTRFAEHKKALGGGRRLVAYVCRAIRDSAHIERVEGMPGFFMRRAVVDEKGVTFSVDAVLKGQRVVTVYPTKEKP